MDDKKFFEKLDSLPEVKPDEEDLAALERIEENEKKGKISLRLPKSLHVELINKAKIEGISLNQYILYKLAR